MIQQKLCGLESWREFGLRSIFDDARSGKSDHRSWLGNDKVSNTRIAGHHPSGRRMGEDADVREAGLAMICKGGAGLRHLHETEHPFIHARSATRGDDD